MRIALLINIFLFSIYLLPGQTSVITVTNTENNVNIKGSLVWALDSAESDPFADRFLIEFNIPGNGPFEIQLTEPLGFYIDKMTVDVTTQPGYYPGIISVNGMGSGYHVEWGADSGALYGLQISGSAIYGLIISGKDNQIGGPGKGNIIISNQGGGIFLSESENATNNSIQSNYIGTNPARDLFLQNNGPGIYFRSSSKSNLIGGPKSGEGNIIFYNRTGISVKNFQPVSIIGNEIAENDTGITIGNPFPITIKSNQIYCNNGFGILYTVPPDAQPPSITQATTSEIRGTGPNAGDSVEVFLTRSCLFTGCEGEIPAGKTVVNADLTWVLSGGYYSPDFQVSAVVITSDGFTSEFAACQTISCSVNDLIVTSTAEEGPGTFLAAINCAQYLPPPRNISFNIPGTGPHQITFLNTGLIAIDLNEVIIDGTTQPDYKTGDIILDGAGMASTFSINGNSCEIYGLHLRNFSESGMFLSGSSHQIGRPGKGNIITENPVGIHLNFESELQVIQGNYIGTTPGEFPDLGNTQIGMKFSAFNEILVGGSQPGEANTIAYNDTAIWIELFDNKVTLSQNSIFCNESGIVYSPDIANFAVRPPEIIDADLIQIKGTGPPDHTIEIFFQDSSLCENQPQQCQGKTFVGRTIANADGNWFVFSNSAFAGRTLTATATDTSGNTSAFGNCFTLSEGKSFVDSIDIPQAFTPGNDGFNDRFIIPNISNYPDNELIVLNRWGNQVYYSRPYKNDWTGTTSSGNDLLEGTYFYVLRIFINGNRNIKRGTITIVR